METVRTFGGTNTSKILRMLGGALLGGAVGYGAVATAVRLQVSFRSLSWFDCIALWLGAVYISFGIFVLYVSTSRRRLARTLEGDDAELLATTDEVRSFRLQAITLALAGVMMLIPTFTAGSLASHPGRGAAIAWIAFAAIVLLFIVQTIANVRLWRASDEFARGLILTVCALTFAIGQGLLFLYAAAERLHLVSAISSWDVITLLLCLYLFVGATISLRYQR